MLYHLTGKSRLAFPGFTLSETFETPPDWPLEVGNIAAMPGSEGSRLGRVTWVGHHPQIGSLVEFEPWTPSVHKDASLDASAAPAVSQAGIRTEAFDDDIRVDDSGNIQIDELPGDEPTIELFLEAVDQAKHGFDILEVPESMAIDVGVDVLVESDDGRTFRITALTQLAGDLWVQLDDITEPAPLTTADALVIDDRPDFAAIRQQIEALNEHSNARLAELTAANKALTERLTNLALSTANLAEVVEKQQKQAAIATNLLGHRISNLYDHVAKNAEANLPRGGYRLEDMVDKETRDAIKRMVANGVPASDKQLVDYLRSDIPPDPNAHKLRDCPCGKPGCQATFWPYRSKTARWDVR